MNQYIITGFRLKGREQTAEGGGIYKFYTKEQRKDIVRPNEFG